LHLDFGFENNGMHGIRKRGVLLSKRKEKKRKERSNKWYHMKELIRKLWTVHEQSLERRLAIYP